MACSLPYQVLQYGADRDLQRVGVWEVKPILPVPPNSYWVIYVHGGAWRDPRIDHKSFTPTINYLLSSADAGARAAIAGIASVDYRLGPHPEFPQHLGDAATTPARERRDAAHPDHLADVWAALRALQLRYGFAGNYVLLGHSAGATLALQLLMGRAALGAPPPADVALPAGVIGMEGIYDMPGLAERGGPPYAELFRGAFGAAENWAGASPMRYTGGFRAAWADEGRGEDGAEAGAAGEGEKKERLVVLGWSPDDELIDQPEITGMARVLEADGVRTLTISDVQGSHDGMWQDGRPFADVILRTIRELNGTK